MLVDKLQTAPLDAGFPSGIPDLGIADLSTMAVAPLPPTYVEGTDHCGKDTVIDLLRATEGAGYDPAPGKGAGFFLGCTSQRLQAWTSEFPNPELAPALLLAATVRDLALARSRADGVLPTYQASHNSLRGAAYSQAFRTDLEDLFAETPELMPGTYLPIALFTSLEAIGQRVLANPNATKFDYLVFEHPDKVAQMLDTIVERCQRLGGVVINTTERRPDEIVDEIQRGRRVRLAGACAQVALENEVLAKSVAILDALKGMKQYRQIAPIIERVLAEIYAF